jgi:hypothetical protein
MRETTKIYSALPCERDPRMGQPKIPSHFPKAESASSLFWSLSLFISRKVREGEREEKGERKIEMKKYRYRNGDGDTEI